MPVRVGSSEGLGVAALGLLENVDDPRDQLT